MKPWAPKSLSERVQLRRSRAGRLGRSDTHRSSAFATQPEPPQSRHERRVGSTAPRARVPTTRTRRDRQNLRPRPRHAGQSPRPALPAPSIPPTSRMCRAWPIPAGIPCRDIGSQSVTSATSGGCFQLLRQYSGASQTQIGIACELSQSKVSNIMRGEQQVLTIALSTKPAATQPLLRPDQLPSSPAHPCAHSIRGPHR